MQLGSQLARAVRRSSVALARERARLLLEKFDPDQPRDEGGKWTSGGGGGGAAETKPTAPRPPKQVRPTGSNAAGADKRVSTAIPSPAAAKRQGINPHKTAAKAPSYSAFQQAMGSTTGKGEKQKFPYRDGVQKLMNQYSQTGGGKVENNTAYPAFLRVPASATPAQAAEAFVEHAKSNIVALYDGQDASYRERSKLWYEGANKIANDWAKEYGISPQAAAASIACMSPQREWDQNVDLAKRMLDTVVKDKDVKFEGELADGMRSAIQDFRETTQNALARAEKKGKEKTVENAKATLQTLDELEKEFPGKTLGQLPEDLQPYAARFASVAKDPTDRGYMIWEPEGNPSGQLAKTDAGDIQKTGWGNFDTIGNVISVVRDDSAENISAALGDRHKVRNFYNNIISPNYGTDATIDTHAVAASMLMPIGQKSPLVENGLGLGGPNNAETGLKGIYALHSEAYRRAAEFVSARDNVQVLPREMQSISWEAVRGLYTDSEKSNKAIVAHANSVWARYQKGEIKTLAEAQQQILAKASPTVDNPDRKGIRPPRWAK